MNCIRGDWAGVRYCLILLLCVLFPSCTKQQSGNSTSQIEKPIVVQQNNELLDSIIQQEAMLIDIPIPLYDERIIPVSHDEIEHDTLVFGYKSPLSFVHISDFFMNQMERYGWRHLVSFDTHSQSILQFKSPDRYCTVVIIKSDNQSLCLSIFIYIKKRASTDAHS